jgi:hypothetical protein
MAYLVKPPEHGVVDLNEDGSFVYTVGVEKCDLY